MKLPAAVDLTAADRSELDAQIVSLVERSRQNAVEVSRLTLDCVAVLASVEARAGSIERQGALQRLWRNLNGKNAGLLTKNERDLARAHYAALQVVKKLQEQELITADLAGIVHTKLDAFIEDTEVDLSELYGLLGATRDEAREELRKLDRKIDAVEQEQKLNRWVATIETRLFGERVYCELDPIDQTLCVANDFYHLTRGYARGDQSAAQLLQAALVKLGRKQAERVNVRALFEALEASPPLLDRLLQGVELAGTEVDAVHAPWLAGALKLRALAGEERQLAESGARILQRHGVTFTRRELRLALVREYLQLTAGEELERECTPFTLARELLAELRLVARPPVAASLPTLLPEPVSPVPALPAKLTAKELGQHLRLTGAELVAELRALGRLERPEQVIPAYVARAVAERRGAAVSIVVPPAPPADLNTEFGWVPMANPQEGLLPGNIRSDGEPLGAFEISGSPVTRRQFAMVLQRFIDVHGGIAFLYSDRPEVYQTRIYVEKGQLRIANAKHANLADREVLDWARWFCESTEDKEALKRWRDGWTPWENMPIADVAICDLEAAGLRVENGRVASYRSREHEPVTGVTSMGALFFATQLTWAFEDKWSFSVPSARHYACLDRDLDVEAAVPVREWCQEQVLYAGPHRFEPLGNANGALVGVGFRLVREASSNRSHSSWSRWA